MFEEIDEKIAMLEIIKDTVSTLESCAECYAPNPETGEHTTAYNAPRYKAYKNIINLLLRQV